MSIDSPGAEGQPQPVPDNRIERKLGSKSVKNITERTRNALIRLLVRNHFKNTPDRKGEIATSTSANTENHEVDKSNPLGLIPLTFEYQGGVVPDERTKMLEQRQREGRERRAREALANEKVFNLSRRPELQREFTGVEEITRNYLAGERERLGFPVDSVYAPKVYYVLGEINDNKGGYVSRDTGLVVVNLRYWGDEETAPLAAAHELDHGTLGEVKILTPRSEENRQFGQFGRAMTVLGLERTHAEAYPPVTEGGFLTNALAEWTKGEVYKRAVDAGFLKRLARSRTAIYDFPPSYFPSDVRRPIHTMRTIMTAKALGIPRHLVEANITSGDSLEQIVLLWKIARKLGERSDESFGPLVDTQGMSRKERNNAFAQRGRDILLRSAFNHDDKVYGQIREVFGVENGNIILAAKHHMNTQETKKLADVLRK